MRWICCNKYVFQASWLRRWLPTKGDTTPILKQFSSPSGKSKQLMNSRWAVNSSLTCEAHCVEAPVRFVCWWLLGKGQRSSTGGCVPYQAELIPQPSSLPGYPKGLLSILVTFPKLRFFICSNCMFHKYKEWTSSYILWKYIKHNSMSFHLLIFLFQEGSKNSAKEKKKKKKKPFPANADV